MHRTVRDVRQDGVRRGRPAAAQLEEAVTRARRRATVKRSIAKMKLRPAVSACLFEIWKEVDEAYAEQLEAAKAQLDALRHRKGKAK